MDKQTAKFIAALTQALPDVPPALMQGWIENPAGLKRRLEFLANPVDCRSQVRDTSHLRFLESVTLAPTSGSGTLVQASDVFIGYLHPFFKKWGTDVAGNDTAEQTVDVHEIKLDGTYAELFGSLGVDLRSLVMTQGQIIEFAHSHRHLLRQNSDETFFLFEVNGELFVARMIGGGRLSAYVYRLPCGHIWYAAHSFRVVVPQQRV